MRNINDQCISDAATKKFPTPKEILAKKNVTQMELLRKKLKETDADVLKEMMSYLIVQPMNADVATIGGVEHGESSNEASLLRLVSAF